MPEREILEIFEEEARKSINDIKSALKELDKDLKNKKQIFKLFKGAHTLKSSSFQMGFYSISYLANLMSDMLKEVKEKNINLDEKKLAFLHDFSNTLEKAIDYALKNKDYPLNKKLFEKINFILGKSEKERINIQKLKFSKESQIKEEKELDDYYIKTSNKIISNIRACINNLSKEFNQKDIECISRDTHTLEGNSLQAEKYLMAYLSSKLKECAKKVILLKKLEKCDLAYMKDISETMLNYFKSIKNKEKKFSLKLINKIEKIIREDYLKLEKKLK